MPFIVLIGQVIGNQADGFSTHWSSDLESKLSLKAAIRHGFKTRQSDDFRIGHTRGEWLAKVSFMGEKFFDDDEVRHTAYMIGMRNYWDDPDDGLGVGWGT